MLKESFELHAYLLISHGYLITVSGGVLQFMNCISLSTKIYQLHYLKTICYVKKGFKQKL